MYSLAVQTPQRGLSPEDVVLYVMMFGFIVEGLVTARKIGIVSQGLRHYTILLNDYCLS